MKNIECNLPDINFNIRVDEKNYDRFINKNQKHKEVKLNNEYYYLVDTQEYIGNKIDDEHYKIIVKENTETSANWIVRIIRELYLREKEDNGYFFLMKWGSAWYST